MTDQIGKLTFCFNLPIKNVNWYNRYFMPIWKIEEGNSSSTPKPVAALFCKCFLNVQRMTCNHSGTLVFKFYLRRNFKCIIFKKKVVWNHTISTLDQSIYTKIQTISTDLSLQFVSFKTVIFVHCKRLIYVATNEWAKKELIHCLLCVMCHIGSISAT